MQCKDNCSSNQCCAKQILNNQPDFKAQKSLVQEVVESAGVRTGRFLHAEIKILQLS